MSFSVFDPIFMDMCTELCISRQEMRDALDRVFPRFTNKEYVKLLKKRIEEGGCISPDESEEDCSDESDYWSDDEDNYSEDEDQYSDEDNDDDYYRSTYRDPYTGTTTHTTCTVNGIPVPTKIDENFHRFFANFDKFFLPQNLKPEPPRSNYSSTVYNNGVRMNDPSLDYLLEMVKPENLQRFISDVTRQATQSGNVFVNPSNVDHYSRQYSR